jgi:hypothetical protein
MLDDVMAADIFDRVDWQTRGAWAASGKVVRLVRFAGAAPAAVNRRVAAVRALFEREFVGALDGWLLVESTWVSAP